jgi:hypothetical protein
MVGSIDAFDDNELSLEIAHLIRFPHKILWLIPTHSSLSVFGGRRWSSPSKNTIVGSTMAAAALAGDFSIKLSANLIEKLICKQNNNELTM